MKALPLLALLLLVACDSVEPGDQEYLIGLRVADLSQDADALIGRWDLVSITSSGQVGPPTTTRYKGIPQGFAFRADGKVEFRDGNGAILTQDYTVVPADPMTPGALPSLRIGDRVEQAWGLDRDRLYIDARPLDGGLYEYVRQ